MFKMHNRIKKEGVKSLPSFTKDMLSGKQKVICHNPYEFNRKTSSKIFSSSNITIKHTPKIKLSVLSSLSSEKTLPLTESRQREKATKNYRALILGRIAPKCKNLTNSYMNSILNDSLKEEKRKSQEKQETSIRKTQTCKSLIYSQEIQNISRRRLTSTSLSKIQSKAKTLFQKTLNKLLSSNIQKGMLIEKDNTLQIKHHKKSSIAERLFLKVTSPLDCVEEHITTNIRPEDKYAKFKKLLKRQQVKNLKLINDVKYASVENEKLLKVYMSKLMKSKNKKIFKKFIFERNAINY